MKYILFILTLFSSCQLAAQHHYDTAWAHTDTSHRHHNYCGGIAQPQPTTYSPWVVYDTLAKYNYNLTPSWVLEPQQELSVAIYTDSTKRCPVKMIYYRYRIGLSGIQERQADTVNYIYTQPKNRYKQLLDSLKN